MASRRLDALTEGFSLAFWVAAGFAILGVIVTLFALKREDLVMEHAGRRARTLS